MIVEEFCQLFAQTFVLFALVAEHYRMLEQLMLQLLRQFAPQVCGRGAEHQEITRRYVVDDLVRVPVHWRTHEIDTARSVQSLLCHSRTRQIARHVAKQVAKHVASRVRSRP
jgi:uncharacterized protein YaaW (UPF0174 family)